MLEPNKVRTEMKALQKHFLEKRDYVVGRLREMGFRIQTVPDSTFYLWLDLEGMPESSKYLISPRSVYLFLLCVESLGLCMLTQVSKALKNPQRLGTWDSLLPSFPMSPSKREVQVHERPILTYLPVSDGLNFFQACLEERVIVVPGIFFDLNPSKRRDLFDSPCHHFVRFSYGPKMETLRMGLDGIERVVAK